MIVSKNEVIGAIFKLFVTREDVYARQELVDGRGMYIRENSGVTNEIVKNHLDGEETIGFYTLKQNNKCKWVCLPPEELIITKNGYKEISKIKIGDCVLTHKGRYKKVIELFENSFDGDLISITPFHSSGFPLIATPNHPVLAVKLNNKKGKTNRIKIKKPTWTRLSDITENDLLAFPIIKKEIDNPNITKDHMRLIGYFLSEGHIDKNRIGFSFHENEKEYHDEVKKLIKKLFNKEVKFRKVNGEKCIQITCCSKRVMEYFLKFGRGARNKKLPQEYLMLPKNKLKEFLETFINGDGSRQKNRTIIGITSKDMSIQIRDIYLKIGYISSLNKRFSKGNLYKGRLIKGGEYYEIITHHKRFNKSNRAWKDEDFVYLSIRSIKKKKYNNKVYNIEVEDDHSYCTIYTCVHNCFDFDNPSDIAGEKKKAIEVYKHVETLGHIASLIEFSGKKGYHVWIFFEETDGKNAKVYADKIKEKFESDCEVFPKQERLTGKGFGNLVKIPLGIHKSSKRRSEVLHPVTFKPMDFEEGMEYLYILSRREKQTLPEANGREVEITEPLKEKKRIIIKRPIPSYTQKMIDSGSSEGKRHETVFRIVKDMWNCGYNKEEIKKEIIGFNKRCVPPKPEYVVIKHVERLCEESNIRLERPDFDKGGLEKEFKKLMGKEEVRKKLNRLSKNEREQQMGNDEKIPFDSKQFFFDCAEILIRHIVFKTTNDNEEVFFYNDGKGIYVNHGEQVIFKYLDLFIEKYATINTKREVLSHIKHKTLIERTTFNNDPTKIVLKNGILDLETLEVYEFSKDYLYTIQIPMEYDPEARCERFLKFLKEKCECEDDIRTLQEYFGFCLLNDMRFEKALLLYGPKRSGKSTLLEILNKMLGDENVSNMSLHFLNENRFALAYLYGMKANICADLPMESLKSISKFMLITGRDRVTCDKKGQDPSSFYSIAKPVFSCNQIPMIRKKEDAFYRRWIIVKFPHTTPVKKIDEHLKTTLIKEELSGILNWAIKGAKNILKNHNIYYNKTEEEVKITWNKNSDSISAFIYEEIGIDDTKSELIRNVYNTYLKYCEKNEVRPENMWIFGRDFKSGTGCGTGRINKIPAYVGICITRTEKQTTLHGKKIKLLRDEPEANI